MKAVPNKQAAITRNIALAIKSRCAVLNFVFLVRNDFFSASFSA